MGWPGWVGSGYLCPVIKRAGLWALTVLGVLLVVWGVASYVSPGASCRGVEMYPGDECSYSSRTDTGTDSVQTYEQRILAARQGAPTIIAVGVLTAGFGAWVALRAPRRDDAASDQASSDIGP